VPKLTFAERWILSNQYRMLQFLEGTPSPFYEQAIEILESGYEDEYEYAAQYVKNDDRILDPVIAKETRDILQMFSEMSWAYEELGKPEDIDTTLLKFWGFDGNNNIEHLSYANFLKRKGDYRDVSVFNSHSDNIETYRDMLRVWEQIPAGLRGLRMPKEYLVAILDAPRNTVSSVGGRERLWIGELPFVADPDDG
jgi:uncharacterized protein YfbU (UPF0304 family)